MKNRHGAGTGGRSAAPRRTGLILMCGRGPASRPSSASTRRPRRPVVRIRGNRARRGGFGLDRVRVLMPQLGLSSARHHARNAAGVNPKVAGCGLLVERVWITRRAWRMKKPGCRVGQTGRAGVSKLEDRPFEGVPRRPPDFTRTRLRRHAQASPKVSSLRRPRVDSPRQSGRRDSNPQHSAWEAEGRCIDDVRQRRESTGLGDRIACQDVRVMRRGMRHAPIAPVVLSAW